MHGSWPATTALALVASLLLIGSTRSVATERVEIVMHYSHFSPSRIAVPRGRLVTIVLRNDDPIDHEWIVGTADVHERHRTGTEPVHEHRSTEVSVPALSTRVTTVIFPHAGALTFVCHLPGHEAYGMAGALLVFP